MADAIREREYIREKEMWRRFAFLAAEIVNISGKSVRRPVRIKDLIHFDDDDKADVSPELTKAFIEKRKRQAMETAKLHKSKFWTKLSDESVRKVTEE